MGSRRRVGLAALALCVTAPIAVVGLSRPGAGDGSDADVPALPAAEERFDGLYDDDGCLRTAVDDRDCSVTADDVDAALAGAGDQDVRHLAGFTGSRWTDQPVAGGPVVLEDTVAMALHDAEIELQGLVRNEGADELGAIAVSATLWGPAGEELATVEGRALVGTVRRGEPVPFALSGPMVATPVDHIDWSATAVAAEPLVRELAWQPYWEQPAGARDPVENYLYGESGPGPHPHVTFGSVSNVGAGQVANVTVVTAWMGDDGRVAAVSRAPVVHPSGNAAAGLDAGAAADALLTHADVPVGAEVLTWMSGS